MNNSPHLAVMHTIWLREHNRLAERLATLNPHWNDEKLFQEAKRLVVAELQHITYTEWLPIVLGKYFYRFDFSTCARVCVFCSLSTHFNFITDRFKHIFY